MDAYLELVLLPDPEFPTTFLMNALFAKLHRQLVTCGKGNIGISFPDVKPDAATLGQRLRLHGTRADLDEFSNPAWLKGMRDHLTISDILPTPANCTYRCVRRVQVKSSPERLRRRAIRRLNISEEAATSLIPNQSAQRLKLPYLTLNSQSTGQQFLLFIEHSSLRNTPTQGAFSHYGLSQLATIPWF